MPEFGLPITAIAIILAAFFLAGLVKGVIGGGLPAISVPVMLNAIDPASAASLTFIPVIITNFWLLFHGGRFKEVFHRYWQFLLPLSIGSLLGAQILVSAPAETMALAIGIFVVTLSPLPFIPKCWAISEKTQRWLNPVAASTMGVLGGATVMLAPVIVYFVALRIDKELFVASMSAIALSSMTPLFVSLAIHNVLSVNEIFLSGVVLFPALIGMALGIWLRRQVSQRSFQRILFVALLGIGLNLIFKSTA